MDGNVHLLGALRGHAGAHFADEPVLEFDAGFDGAAADDEDVGIKGVDHLVKEETERVGLHAEDVAAERVALFGHAADQLGGFGDFELMKFVIGIACEKVG